MDLCFVCLFTDKYKGINENVMFGPLMAHSQILSRAGETETVFTIKEPVGCGANRENWKQLYLELNGVRSREGRQVSTGERMEMVESGHSGV